AMSVRIEGKRIYLRKVATRDVNEKYHRWLNDPQTNQYMETRFLNNTMANIRKYVKTTNRNPNEVFLAICMKKTDEHIGNIKIGAINRLHDLGELSYFIGEKDY